MNSKSVVVSLHIAPGAALPMQTVSEVRAVAGRGLPGDRYFDGKGTYSNHPGSGREVTLIESEALTGLSRDYGVDISGDLSRRNIVTYGIALNHLVGRQFSIGSVKLRGTRLCEPCAHLERLTRQGMLRGLIHRGGLRAKIVSEGMIRVGDEFLPLDD
jgi:MOSC domain-containing protein YiiM